MKVIVVKTPKEYYRVSTAPPIPPTTSSTAPPIKPPESIKPPPIPEPPLTVTPPPQDTLPAPPPVKTPESTPRFTQVTADPDENLREVPKGKIIGKVKKGTSLAILEDKGQWLRVRLEDGTEAWIWKASTSEASKTPQKKKSPSPM